MSFEEAQTFIWSEGIQSRTEFEVWSREGKRPEDFPANPSANLQRQMDWLERFLRCRKYFE